MEVKVGVKGGPRELTIDIALSAAELAAAVQAALAAENGLLVLVDEKGRQLLVPADKLAYVEIGDTSERRVGFGTM